MASLKVEVFLLRFDSIDLRFMRKCFISIFILITLLKLRRIDTVRSRMIDCQSLISWSFRYNSRVVNCLKVARVFGDLRPFDLP